MPLFLVKRHIRIISSFQDPTVYGASWTSKANNDGMLYFDGQPTGLGTILNDHDVLFMGYNPPPFPINDFTFNVTCIASNDNSFIGSGQNEFWPRLWELDRQSFRWTYTRGNSSGGHGEQFVRISWAENTVPYGTNTNITLTRSGSSISLYLDGALTPYAITNYSYTNSYQELPVPPHVFPVASLPVYNYGLMIGSMQNDGGSMQRFWSYQGYIDNIAVFTNCLSSNQVYQLYRELQNEAPTTLLGQTTLTVRAFIDKYLHGPAS